MEGGMSMSDYIIFTDSAADVPLHYYEKYDIRVVPMDYTLNGEVRTAFVSSIR